MPWDKKKYAFYKLTIVFGFVFPTQIKLAFESVQCRNAQDYVYHIFFDIYPRAILMASIHIISKDYRVNVTIKYLKLQFKFRAIKELTWLHTDKEDKGWVVE